MERNLIFQEDALKLSLNLFLGFFWGGGGSDKGMEPVN